MASDHAYTQGLYTSLTRLNDPTHERSALDGVVSQKWGSRRCDWYDAAAELEVAELLRVGWYVISVVEVGATPGKDRDQIGNQRKLDHIASPFTAKCFAGTGDNDGLLSWNTVIRVSHRMDEDELIVLDYEPFDLPLEIGHTDPETTIWHLWETGGIARWPYGHERITVLMKTCSPDRKVFPPGRPRLVSGKRLLDPDTQRPDLSLTIPV